MKETTFTIEVKNGLYIGDLCYELDDSVYYGVFGKANCADGKYVDPATKLEFAAVHTYDGDGVYYDEDDCSYDVDAGIIGICDTGLCVQERDCCLGKKIQTAGPVTITYHNNGIIEVSYGEDNHVIIKTGPDYSDTDEYKEEDELMNHTVRIDDRYLIYLDTGIVYDTVDAKDIPQYVFDIRDKITSNN